jgi:hypothetical protein
MQYQSLLQELLIHVTHLLGVNAALQLNWSNDLVTAMHQHWRLTKEGRLNEDSKSQFRMTLNYLQERTRIPFG